MPCRNCFFFRCPHPRRTVQVVLEHLHNECPRTVLFSNVISDNAILVQQTPKNNVKEVSSCRLMLKLSKKRSLQENHLNVKEVFFLRLEIKTLLEQSLQENHSSRNHVNSTSPRKSLDSYVYYTIWCYCFPY